MCLSFGGTLVLHEGCKAGLFLDHCHISLDIQYILILYKVVSDTIVDIVILMLSGDPCTDKVQEKVQLSPKCSPNSAT